MGEFDQTADRGHHVVVDHNRLSKLLATMHHSMPDRVNAGIASFQLARLLQHLHQTLNRLGMGRDILNSLGNCFPVATEQ